MKHFPVRLRTSAAVFNDHEKDNDPWAYIASR